MKQWIEEALASVPGASGHLISISSPCMEYRDALYNSSEFDIVSIHGAANAWNNEAAQARAGHEWSNYWDTNPTPTPPCNYLDFCDNDFKAMLQPDFALDIRTERQYLKNQHPNTDPFPEGKHIIVDTDGLWGKSDASGWARDFDPVCYHIMTTALLEKQSFDTKEFLHNKVNPDEKDCTRNDNIPPVPDDNSYLGMDGPYFSGNQSQLTEIFEKSSVLIAGYGMTYLTPSNKSGNVYALVERPYGTQVSDVKLKLTGMCTGNTPLEFPMSKYSGFSMLPLYTASIDLDSVRPQCELDVYDGSITLKEKANGTPIPKWPELTIFSSRNTTELPSNFTNASNSMPLEQIISEQCAAAPNTDALVELDFMAQKMTQLRSLMINDSQQMSDLGNSPIIMAAGFMDTRIVDIYGGTLLIVALVSHPQNVPIKGVYVLLDYSLNPTPALNEMTEFQDNIYTFRADMPFNMTSHLNSDLNIKFKIYAIDVNNNLSDAWPELVVHDPEGSPNDNYRPYTCHTDTDPPEISGNIHFNNTRFYDDKLVVSWKPVNRQNQPAWDAVCDLSYKISGDDSYILAASDITDHEYTLENLNSCTSYSVKVIPHDNCGNQGTAKYGSAYTGNPEVPFNFHAEKDESDNFTLKWNVRNIKDWKRYEVFSMGGCTWELYGTAYEPELFVGEITTPFSRPFKVRAITDDPEGNEVEGCFSKIICISSTSSVISSKKALFLDVNDDNYLDAIVETSPGNCLLYFQNADGSYTPSDQTFSTSIEKMDVADLNGDMVSDLIYTQDTELKILINNDSIFTETDSLCISDNDSKTLKAADLNGDGTKEVVVVKCEEVLIAKKDADSKLKIDKSIESTDNILLAIGDLNGDQTIDMVTVNSSNEVRLFSNDGTGDMTNYSSFTVNFTVESIQLSDSDADWDLDIVLNNTDQNQIYYNDGSGQFQTN